MFVNEEILKRGRAPDALFAFFHSQRTGGSEFVRWLFQACDKSRIYRFRNVENFVPWHDVTPDQLKGFRWFVGFNNYEERDLGRPIVGASVVRHPFFRICSLYEMSQRDTDHFLHEMAIKSTFEEYVRAVEARDPSYLHNMNSRRITNAPSAIDAYRSMGRNFGIVAATGTVSAMTALLRDYFDRDTPALPEIPPDEERYAAYMSSPLFGEIIGKNSADFELYSYVRSLGISAPNLAKAPAALVCQEDTEMTDTAEAPSAGAHGTGTASGCPVCGNSVLPLGEGGHCPTCRLPARGRSLAPLLRRIVGPHLASSSAAGLPLLAFAMTENEKKLLSPYFGSFKSVSLFGNYRGEHETGVDVRDLSRFPAGSFSGAFSILLFDYFPEFEKALAELYRVVAPGGVVFHLILGARVLADSSPATVTREIKPRPGYFEYVPKDGVLYNVTVGQDWFLRAMSAAGFEPLHIRIPDVGSDEVSHWFVGIKPQ